MKPISPIVIRLASCCSFALFAFVVSLCAQAEEFHAGFDEDLPSWRVNFDKSRLRLLSHRRHQFLFVRGRASESVEFDASVDGQFVQLEHTLPQARVFDELKLSLWVRSNRPGATLYVRVAFPHQIDPSTGKVLQTYLRGETYTDAGRWQQLNCATPQKLIDQQLRQIRARLRNIRIDPREAYVDRAYVTTRLSKGTTEFFLDELKLGPIVKAQTKDELVQVAEESPEDHSPVEFRLDRLRVEGVPFFPRMVPFHGELPTSLKQSRANVVWVPHLENQTLIDSLQREKLWITATPPRPKKTTDVALGTEARRIAPFGAKTKPILFWNLGLQIPADAKDALVDWKRMIQDADTRYRRPLLADVNGRERVYSRHLGMLGVSRFPIGSSLTPKEYRDWLIKRRKIATMGSFVWTWIQTEMGVPTVDNTMSPATHSMVVEPEQMRLQTYAALAAGCRGIGYWKTASLDSSDPAARERRLAITQLNLELELLEPWLATGTVVEHVPFRVSQQGQQLGSRRINFRRTGNARSERNALLRARDYELQVNAGYNNEMEATIIRTDYGKLVLPIWYHRTANYVPSQMAGNDATIVVRGVPQAASAWEISTTGIRSLESEPKTGGKKITIPHFDQTAAIILTSDRALIAKIRRKMEGMAKHSARTSIDLVRTKLERVRQVDSELERLGVGQLDAPQLLARAKERLANAEIAFSRREDYAAARQASREAAQSLRILQSAHWYDAIRRLTSPVAAPYTVNFQSLPNHWRLMEELGRSQFKNDANILQSGDFEDSKVMIASGWNHSQNEIDGVKAQAELNDLGGDRGYALRLVAVPDIGREPPRIVDQNPVTVTTPPMPVSTGQIVHVSGRVRIIGRIIGSQDGVMLYDNQAGKQRALTWKEPTNWQQFELLRKAEQDGTFRLTITLTGLGEAQFDDIRVVPHSPRVQTAGATAPQSGRAPASRSRAWNLLPKIPKWSNPLPSIPNSIPRLENPIPRLNNALPKWNRFNSQTPVPQQQRQP